jgi:hypothetical protein
MLDRTAEQFEAVPSRLVADAGYGSAEMIGWLVDERGIEPHVKLMDKSERTDGALSREPTSPLILKATAMSALAASPRNAAVLVRLTMTAASVVVVTRWSAQPCTRQRMFCCIMADGHRSDPGPCGSRREAV